MQTRFVGCNHFPPTNHIVALFRVKRRRKSGPQPPRRN
jgi:hypothetical protein